MRKFSFLLIFFILGCGTQKIADYKNGSVKVDETAGDGGLDSIISPYRDSMELQMTELIGSASVALEKGNPESPLGNFAAEAVYLEGLKIGQNSRGLGPELMTRSFSLLNNGGLRTIVNQGDVTVGNIYELMPFDNTLVLEKIGPDKVRELCRYLYEKNGQPLYNATFRLSENTEEMTIGGEPYNFDQDVVVITSDYLAGGGDNMNFFLEPQRKFDSGKFLRDVLIDYVRQKKNLGTYEPTGKLEIIK